MKKITYGQTGVSYRLLDPVKKLALRAGKKTAINLKKYGMEEVGQTRGEAAFVWKQGDVFMASVIESLGTKNLVADAMRKITGRTYYDVIGNETVASIINDLASVGAKPLVVHAFWAVGDSSWLADEERVRDLIKGWKSACDLAGATWGGGETPSYNDIVVKKTIALSGSAVGIIKSKKRLITDGKLQAGDRILLLKSNGVNANGLSLARAVSKKLQNGYATKLSNGQLYGEALLSKTNVYAKLIQALLDANIDIHYLSNITGHGLRKIMRSPKKLTYVIEKVFSPQEVFNLIQKHAGLDDYEMYKTYNMGQDYVIFLPQKDVKRAQEIIKKNKFESIDAGYIKSGQRQVKILPKKLIFTAETLDLR